MKIVVTGASSYVGAGTYSFLKNKNEFEVIGTYNSNKLFSELEHLDITNRENVFEFIKMKSPKYIIHVAANANGNWCEKNPNLAISINEQGTKNIVDVAKEINSKIIFISSFAAIINYNLYAKTKMDAEEYVKQNADEYIVLRPSLIVGFSPNTANDRPFNRILKNITDRTPAIYDTSWKFQPTYLRHLNEVIYEIINKKIINETIEIATNEITTRYDLAKDILSEFNINVISEDKKDNTPPFINDLIRMKELNLKKYTYNEMIKEIRKEIKNYLDKV